MEDNPYRSPATFDEAKPRERNRRWLAVSALGLAGTVYSFFGAMLITGRHPARGVVLLLLSAAMLCSAYRLAKTLRLAK